MLILRLTRKIAMFCGICSVSDDYDVRFKYGQMLVILFFTAWLNLFLWCSVNEALYEFEFGDVDSYLFAILQVVGTLSVIGSYAATVLQKENIRKVINGLQKIADQCNFLAPETKSLYFLMKSFAYFDEYFQQPN